MFVHQVMAVSDYPEQSTLEQKGEASKLSSCFLWEESSDLVSMRQCHYHGSVLKNSA